MASVFKERESWVVKWKDAAGNWKKQRTSCATKAEAKAYAGQLEHRADLQRHGLVPMDGPSDLTFGDLLAWYDKYHSHRRKSKSFRLSVAKHLEPELNGLPLVDVTVPRLEALLIGLAKSLSPMTVNHLRAFVHHLFSLAIRADLWSRANPVTRVPRLKVPRRPPSYLREDEVRAVLAHVDAGWRNFFATAVFTGMRRGELGGLQKRDVELDSEKPTITVCRSWGSDTTKGGEVRVVPVHPELVPYLRDAMRTSNSELVFPRDDGSMHDPARVDLSPILRSALARAGLVRGYRHVCRWCGYKEESPDDELRRCPARGCGKKLWPVAQKRRERFHDLRHTTATLLLKAGTPLAVVQRLVGHSDPAITTEIYGHLEAEDARTHLERLSLSPLPPELVVEVVPIAVNAGEVESRGLPVVPPALSEEKKAPGAFDFSNDSEGFKWSGRQDLNLRPLAPQAVRGPLHGVPPTPRGSIPSTIRGARSPDAANWASIASTASTPTKGGGLPVVPLSAVAGGVLTVVEVAALLKVTTATVYTMVDRGALPHFRVLHAIRIRRDDVERLIGFSARSPGDGDTK